MIVRIIFSFLVIICGFIFVFMLAMSPMLIMAWDNPESDYQPLQPIWVVVLYFAIMLFFFIGGLVSFLLLIF